MTRPMVLQAPIGKAWLKLDASVAMQEERVANARLMDQLSR